MARNLDELSTVQGDPRHVDAERRSGDDETEGFGRGSGHSHNRRSTVTRRPPPLAPSSMMARTGPQGGEPGSPWV